RRARHAEPGHLQALGRGVLPAGTVRAGGALERALLAEREDSAHAARDPADRVIPGRRYDRCLRVPGGARAVLTATELREIESLGAGRIIWARECSPRE